MTNDFVDHRFLDEELGFFASAPGPRAAVNAAIGAANHAARGAFFEPLSVAFARSADMSVVWASESGERYIEFVRFNGARKDGFLPMGDQARTTRGTGGRTPVMLVRSDTPGMLAHPAGFIRIGDDEYSGNPNDIAYYWPIAPTGFAAMGLCIGINGAQPDASQYWCVSTDLVAPCAAAPYWSDEGQHWKKHDASLSVPVAGAIECGDKLVLAPTTLLSNAYGSAPGIANCLVLSKLFLPVAGGRAPDPGYDRCYGQGSRTAQGIEAVAVLPCSAVGDPYGAPDLQASPFYYLAGHPYWTCTSAFAAPDGGTYASSFTVGASKSESSSFRKASSVTLGAATGIAAGGPGDPGARVSVSYAREMQLTASIAAGSGTDASHTRWLNLPKAKRMLVWQKNVDFVVYRTNGQALAVAQFQTSELTFTGSEPV